MSMKKNLLDLLFSKKVFKCKSICLTNWLKQPFKKRLDPKKRMNKKGAEITIGTIIIIILALVVLVIIIYGFSTGWANLWEKITSFGGGGVNVQSVVQSCQLACSTQAAFDYCSLQRTIRFEDENRDLMTVTANCEKLANLEEVEITKPSGREGEFIALPQTELSCDIDCVSSGDENPPPVPTPTPTP